MTKWLKKKALSWGVEWVKGLITLEWVQTQVASLLQTLLTKAVNKVSSETLQKWCIIFRDAASLCETIGNACSDGEIEVSEVSQIMNQSTALIGKSDITTEMLHSGIDNVAKQIEAKL